jgi:hypothetical protein
VTVFYERAAGAGRKYAPASLDRPLSIRPMSFVRFMSGLGFWAPPQLIR